MRIYQILILLISLFSNLHGSQEVVNVDKPLKGYWDIQMKALWTVDGTGEKPFTIIDGMVFGENETCYIMDRKHYKIFIFDANGKYISEFGNKGNGPGEFSTLRSLYLTEGLLIVVDDNHIHYFSPEGQYMRSVRNKHIDVSPVSFISPEKFISVTAFTGANNISETGAVGIHDLKNHTTRKLIEFPKYKEGAIKVQTVEGETTHTNVYSFSVSSLTPAMILYHKNDRLYYGMNNEYRITIADLEGKIISGFILKREKLKVSDEYKERAANRFNFPQEIKKMVVKRLPDYRNFFYKIQTLNKDYILVYALGSGKSYISKFDIFSDTGRYLYIANVEIEKDFAIKNVYFNGNAVYVIKRDEDGNTFLSKYSARLPE